MRVLLLHPEDDLQEGPWASQRWDRAIDLGKAGEASYARAAESFGCPVTGLSEFRKDFREMRRVRELIGLGLGRLNDSFGLDWWELTSILVHQQFEAAFLMREVAETIGPQDEVYVSRSCFHSEVLRFSLESRLHAFSSASDQQKRGVGRYFRAAKKFPLAQLLEIFWDKADPGYQFRGAFSSRPRSQTGGVVLLPSCYISVARTAAAYAESLPEAQFLLVATRRSGWMKDLPSNVSATWLRRYASVGVQSRKAEHADLMQRWDCLRKELNAVPEFHVLSQLGAFDEFSARFALGLEVRDAWRNVFDSEPVQAVVCADDSNPYTHIPLLLAKHRGLPAVACHHGALDGRYMFKRNHADVLLAKGKMEEDYLVRLCGVSGEEVEVGAPLLPRSFELKSDGLEKSSIVFFSEAYEVAGGRARSFYQDVLPPLADIALAEGKNLIVKLHPSESLSERKGLVQQILNAGQQRVTSVTSAPLSDERFNGAWFGVTVMSTVAVECAMRGIPCFLCAWLESWPYGYVAQFEQFEIGICLGGPEKFREIAAILRDYRVSARIRENCWTEIAPRRLRSLWGMVTTDDSVHNIVTRTA